MVKITLISPCSSLASYVKNYQYIEFNTGEQELIKPWHALPETYLIFFLKEKPLGLFTDTGAYHRDIRSDVWIQGFSTHFNGLMKFKGDYALFGVQFLPNGFNKLLGLPLMEITNQLLEANNVWGRKCTDLQDRLQNSQKPREMAILMDAFLRDFIPSNKIRTDKDPIAIISKELLQSQNYSTIHTYAERANMSARNFERIFKEQVGMSPKLFCRSLRFNRAVELKTNFPQKKWTDITYECGYYDQMHLIRDFKRFADSSPKSFFKKTPPLRIDYSKVTREQHLG